jgi:uncharacterized protein
MKLIAISILTASLLSACGSAPKEHFYTLQPPAGSSNASNLGTSGSLPTNADGSPVRVVLAGFTLPDRVARPQLVVRRSAQSVQILEQQRWAEPLNGAIQRVLADNLSAQLGGLNVALRNDYAQRDAALQLSVDVLQFESVPGQEAILEVQWQWRNAAGALLAESRGVWREAVPSQGQAPSVADYTDLVAGHQRALQKCAGQIALSLPKR